MLAIACPFDPPRNLRKAALPDLLASCELRGRGCDDGSNPDFSKRNDPPAPELSSALAPHVERFTEDERRRLREEICRIDAALEAGERVLFVGRNEVFGADVQLWCVTSTRFLWPRRLRGEFTAALRAVKGMTDMQPSNSGVDYVMKIRLDVPVAPLGQDLSFVNRSEAEVRAFADALQNAFTVAGSTDDPPPHDAARTTLGADAFVRAADKDAWLMERARDAARASPAQPSDDVFFEVLSGLYAAALSMMAGLIDTIAPEAKDHWDTIARRQSATRATDAYNAFIALPRLHADREAVDPVSRMR